MLPSFIVPGESKCGTTSLYRYLVKHPNVLPCDRKEPKNFIDYPRSLLYCRSHYPTLITRYWVEISRRRRAITGEATAEYLSSPDLPESLYSVLPSLKIIVLLRNPVHRAYSDYHMFRSRNRVHLEFDEVVDRSLAWLGDVSLQDLVQAALGIEGFYLRFVARGLYVKNLARWLSVFPRRQILILKSEDLFAKPTEVVDEVFEFLELDTCNVDAMEARRKGDYEQTLDDEVADRLRRFYAPYNAELYKLIGRNMGWENEL